MVQFGKKLEESLKEEWTPYYLDYESLKAALKPLRVTLDELEAEERKVDLSQVAVDRLHARLHAQIASWFQMLDSEFEKINSFYIRQEKLITEQIKECKLLRRKLGDVHDEETAAALSVHQDRRRYMSLTASLNQHLADLRAFSELNYTGVFKIAKKFDKQTGRNSLPTVMAKADRQPFYIKAATPLPGWKEHVEADFVFTDEHKQQFQADVKAAQSLVDDAILSVRLLLSRQERQELYETNTSTRNAALLALTNNVHVAKASDLKETMFRAKYELYNQLCNDISRELQNSYPEGAAVVEKLHQAHEQLFRPFAYEQAHDHSNAHIILAEAAAAVDDDEASMAPSDVLDELRRRMSFVSNEGSDRQMKAAPEPHYGPPPSCSKQWWVQSPAVPPIIKWLPQYNFRKNLKADIIAGITIAVMVIPQGLAYALLANLPPVYGIYAAMIPGIIYALLGGSQQGAVGPMSIPCLLAGAAVSNIGPKDEAEAIALTMGLSVMVGIICLVMGAFKLGFLVRFIANPVLNGFASAAAVVTMVSVSKDILRVDVKKSSVIYESFPRLIDAAADTHVPSLLYGLLALGIIIFIKVGGGTEKFKFLKPLPAPLVCMASMIVLAFILCTTGGEDDHVVPLIPGGGLAAASPLLSAAASTFFCGSENAGLAYASQSPATALASLASGTANFAVTDWVNTTSVTAPHFALFATPFVLAVNWPSQVTMSCASAAGIFRGAISAWNDAGLVADNSGKQFTPAAVPISPMVLAGEQGMTATLTSFFATCDGNYPGPAPQHTWPTWFEQLADETTATTRVKAVSGSIAFMSLKAAQEAGLKVVTLINGGQDVKPTPAAVASALSAAQAGFNSTNVIPAAMPSIAGTAGSWPLTSIATLMLPTALDMDCGLATQLVQFWRWFMVSDDVTSAISRDIGSAEVGLGGAPLPESYRLAAQDALTSATCDSSPAVEAGSAVPAAGEGWLCPNPPAGHVSCGGVKILGDVPSTLPTPSLPDAPLELQMRLGTDAILITFVAFIESIAVAKMYAVKHGYNVDASQELVALGAANILGGCFLSLPVMCAFGRSAVNNATGAKSQLSLLISGFVVAALILTITPVLYYLPKPVLSAIVITAVAGLIDIKGAKRLYKVNRSDLAIMGVSFLATLCLGVELGMLAAMGFSLLSFIYFSTSPRISDVGRVRGTIQYRELHDRDEHVDDTAAIDAIENIRIVKVFGTLFFANASVLKDNLVSGQPCYDEQHRKYFKWPWRCIILDLSSVSGIDSTAMATLEEAAKTLKSKGVRFLLASPNRKVMETLVKAKYDGDIESALHIAVRSEISRGGKGGQASLEGAFHLVKMMQKQESSVLSPMPAPEGGAAAGIAVVDVQLTESKDDESSSSSV